ncbi:MAG: DNA-binding protein [Oscillospiraceae bacterium]|nr:DNA-binding protein [Oscillospiraceae bacterium]
MKSQIVSVCGNTKYHCVRLHRGEDLLNSVRQICKENNIKAGLVLSGVGCISKGKIRDASGVTIREISEDCEIVSLNGTVSAKRCHIHIALSKEDMSTIGGHLCTGCIINTTCELIIAELPDLEIDTEDDPETGYDELIFKTI